MADPKCGGIPREPNARTAPPFSRPSLDSDQAGACGHAGGVHDPIVSPPPGLVSPAAAAAVGRRGSGRRTGRDQMELRKRAVDLFTFLRELVSLRTTVVRNCDSYDRVLWLNEVPRDPECDCVAFGGPRKDEERLVAPGPQARLHRAATAPARTAPVGRPRQARRLVGRCAPALGRNRRAARQLPAQLPSAGTGGGDDEAGGRTAVVRLADPRKICAEWDRYIDEQWRPWAAEDRRMRGVLRIYTDLFSLYQQQKELGEAYEVVIALGQLRWAPKAGVSVNRHLVAVQTSIEFDAQRGVITVGPAAEGAKPRLEEDMLELDSAPPRTC